MKKKPTTTSEPKDGAKVLWEEWNFTFNTFKSKNGWPTGIFAVYVLFGYYESNWFVLLSLCENLTGPYEKV